MIPAIQAAFAGIMNWKNVIIATAVVSLATFLYVRDLNHRLTIEKISKENAILKIQEQESARIILQYQKDVVKIQSSNKILSDVNKKLAESKRKLEESLYRERDGNKSLEKMALDDSEAIKKIVNKATAEAFRCLEIASGAETNEEELKLFNDCIVSIPQ